MNNYLIIGRTNVGKSYFFNLFSKDHKTISIDQPHTTVDIIKQRIVVNESSFNIYDTPGFDKFENFKLILKRIDDLSINKREIIYVVKDTYTDIDIMASKHIFNLKIPLMIYINSKNITDSAIISNFYYSKFRYNEDGFTKIRNAILANPININKPNLEIHKTVAIFGKENTGKSSLFNILVNKNLSLTDSERHTTRDSVKWSINHKNLELEIIDTAGFIRSKSKRKRGVLESLSIRQSEDNLINSDLIILMLEANSESRLDLTLIGELQKKNKSFMLFVNKIDLIEDKEAFKKRFVNHLSKNHNFFSSLNIYFISVINLTNNKIMDLIYKKITQPFDFKTSYLNKIAKKMNLELSKVTINAKSFKIFYITAFSINNKNYFKIFSNFNDSQIKQNTKTFLRKMLINEFNLKGYAFNVIYN